MDEAVLKALVLKEARKYSYAVSPKTRYEQNVNKHKRPNNLHLSIVQHLFLVESIEWTNGALLRWCQTMTVGLSIHLAQSMAERARDALASRYSPYGFFPQPNSRNQEFI